MKIPNPEEYFYKKLIIHSPGGIITKGTLFGYCYDYDDNNNEILELTIEACNGILFDFTEDEIESIEIIKK